MNIVSLQTVFELLDLIVKASKMPHIDKNDFSTEGLIKGDDDGKSRGQRPWFEPLVRGPVRQENRHTDR